MNTDYLYLGIAILAETVATTALKSAESFTRPGPSLITVAGYLCAFYCLSRVLATIPLGIAYAIWSGAGIVLITLMGWAVHRQALDLPALVGIAFIVTGVVVINVFSESLAS